MEFERSTLRTLSRDTLSTRAISRLDTPLAFSSRIVVLCDWLSIVISYPLADAVQLLACAFDMLLRLLLLVLVHLCRCFAHSTAGPAQNRGYCLQLSLQCRRLCGGRRWRLSLRFQKQLWLRKNALANRA